MTVIEEFINSQQGKTKEDLLKIHEYITKHLEGITQTFSYGLPTYKMHGKNLFHFGVFKNHIGIYPTPEPIEKLFEELAPYKVSKGTIQIGFNQEFPHGLIRKIIDFNAQRLREKQQKKS